MTLADILKAINPEEPIVIQFRVDTAVPGSDATIDKLTGMCRYHKGTLKSLDDNYYSLSMEYERWEYRKNADGVCMLTVWLNKNWGQ